MEFANLREELFYRALRIRRVEERIIVLYPSDCIQSPVHLSIGQEAVAVGTCQALAPQDWVFGTYRGHAFYLAKGGDLNAMMAEFYGKVTGCCAGKGGSMHLASREHGIIGCSAIVASTISHGVGAALAGKLQGRDQVMLTVFGDGAVDEGSYHESMNFCALKQLPVVMLCENNGLAVHSFRKARQSFEILEHAASYGLPTTLIEEGWDPFDVYEQFAGIVQKVRAGEGPQFVQINTFRYREHVGPGDDFSAGYRSKADYHEWAKNDPLLKDEELIAKFDPQIKEEIDEAVRFADESAWPDQAELLKDVY